MRASQARRCYDGEAHLLLCAYVYNTTTPNSIPRDGEMCEGLGLVIEEEECSSLPDQSADRRVMRVLLEKMER